MDGTFNIHGRNDKIIDDFDWKTIWNTTTKILK
jgi:hypothetical protein